ncbi:CoA transferase [Streptomyces sp. NL15-2K]|uniref:CoA transferase n=1 Tax=Streptomyces sp. NL15-2K TaxID=376149 RepID=UPI000F5601BB|nr:MULTISPECIES: CoA transferase [Actinomycetes]WKX08022.1 CoA transferase [Kutzneria buriramensis]GCB50519.1 CAIB/BAIF family protein [Streptomyces sp. NL15-2K]
MIDIEFAWSAVGGDPALLPRVSTVVREGALQGRLPVRELARACVGACASAAAELGARRAGLAEVPGVRVDDGAVATAFVSERHLLVDGRAPVTFAPLSRFWRTADGWVRTHANYPHHRARLLGALGVPDDAAAVASVEAALAERSALEAEEAVYAAGGLAVALRTPEEWAAHEQAAAVAGRPLVERGRLDSARARVLAPIDGDGVPLLPAAGLRVLDLTRVIAGPVATRTLALLGADVLRVDAPRLPELPDQHADTGFGKRSTTLDLAADRRAFGELLAAADVVVTGYRPGALDRFGLSPEALAERRPGVVVAQLSAWGAYGPWAERRGFDSLVQVATGISAVEGSMEQPGALPAQALDHGTGYLLAAAVLRALTEQSYEGGSRFVRLALARTAQWLVNGVGADDTGDAPDGGPGSPTEKAPYGGSDSWLAETDSALGRLRYARSPVAFEGGPVDWARPPGPWGSDAPGWI